MVAYSFNPRFVLDIENGRKRQTIRALRRRHARPGEALQLYTGMRTKRCRLIRDDVVCVGVDEVLFDLRALDGAPDPTHAAALEHAVGSARLPLLINGIPLETPELRNAFAADDGFEGWCLDKRDPIQPFAAMVLFWMGNHGPRLFEGVMIRWEVRS